MTSNTQNRWPDFLVIGSMKCGTTSLHNYLSHHPEIYVARPKELNFFVGEWAGGAAKPVPHWSNCQQSVEWYQQHFRSDRKVCGELSPSYVAGPWISQTAKRIHDLVPQVRLLLLVRQPLDRCWSHYLMVRMNAHSQGITFEQFMTDELYAQYLSYSDYGSQLQHYLRYFPRESIHIVESQSLDHHRDETLREIFRFLNVDPEFRSAAFDRKLYEGRRRRFPSELGVRILKSRVMEWAASNLPFTAFEWLREVVLVPFSIPKPKRELSEAVEAAVIERYRREVALARQLSGLPLKSLEM